MTDCLDNRLKEFVKSFVKHMEDRLSRNVKNAAVGTKPEPGKSIEFVSGVAKVATELSGLAVLSNAAGKAIETRIGVLTCEKRKKGPRAVEDTFRFLSIKQRVAMFVEAAGHIFMSYEMPFMALTGSIGSSVWTALSKLAADAADRLCNDIMAGNQTEMSPQRIFESVRRGASNNISLMSHICQTWPNNEKMEQGKPGHTVCIDGNQVKTSDVYAKVGVVSLKPDGRLKHISGSTTLYRRLLSWESNEAVGEPERLKLTVSYEYALTDEDIGQKLKQVLGEICAEYAELRSVLMYDEIQPAHLTTSLDITDALQTGDGKVDPESVANVNGDPRSNMHFVEEMLPVLPKLHIERSISNRLLLKPEIFKIASDKPAKPDIFVYKGIESYDLSKLLHPHVFSSSGDQHTLPTFQHICLEEGNDEHWDDIVKFSSVPTHLISCEDGTYVLQQSTKVTDFLLQYAVDTKRSDSAYISEDQFVDQLKSSKKGALLCDIPGMGKTMLMTSVARKYFNQAKDSVVVFAKLSAFSKTIRDPPSNKKVLKYALKLLYGDKQGSLLYENFKKTSVEILFFLDGFDEIMDEYLDQTTKFLKALAMRDKVRLVISSRPHMRKHLENVFHLVSFDILPFGEEEQVNTVVAIWKSKYSNYSNDELRYLAKQCVDSVKNINKDEHLDILGVPLKCYMLATINDKYAQHFCAPGRRASLDLGEPAKALSVCELYGMFVEHAVKRIETVPSHHITRETVLAFHTYKALKLLFPEIAKGYYNKKYFQPFKNKSKITQLGLLQLAVNGKLEFVSRQMPVLTCQPDNCQ